MAAGHVQAKETAAASSAKRSKAKPVYMFGFATNFNDSTAYLIPVHLAEGATVDSKTHFLVDRDLFALQFKRFIDAQHQSQVMSTVFYDTSRSSLEKQYLKVKRLAQREHAKIQELPSSAFTFRLLEDSEQ